MSRLTESEIQGLFEFTRKKYVRYKDVQVELVDHLASAIEELQEKDPNINFTKALYQVYEGFGIFGFAKIVQAKEKAMYRFWFKRIWKMFLSYFKPPLIYGTVGSMILVFQLLSLGIVPMRTFVIASSVIFFGGIIYAMMINNTRDNKIKDFLFLKSYYGISTSILFFPFYMVGSFMDLFTYVSRLHTDNQVIVASIFFPLCFILVYILSYQTPRLLKKEFDEKYWHLVSFSH